MSTIIKKTVSLCLHSDDDITINFAMHYGIQQLLCGHGESDMQLKFQFYSQIVRKTAVTYY